MSASAAKEEIVLKVEQEIKKTRGRVSPSDVAASTGFSLNEVKDAMSRLIELYECRVTMNQESGSIMFIFKYPFLLRGSKTFREKFIAFLAVFWKIFTIIYKAAIGVILIAYTAIFAVLLLVLILRGLSSDDDDSGGIGNIVGGLFRAIFEGLSWFAWSRSVEYAVDPQGMRYKQFPKEKNKGKNFVTSVFHFVFGPDRPNYDPLNDAKEVAAYLRNVKTKLTSAKIVDLSGATYEQAESLLANYASKFDGELYINTDGVVVAEFPEMGQKVSKELEGGKIEYYVDEVEPPYELTGNTGGKNGIIITMNIFNLIMSFVGYGYFTFDSGSNILGVLLGIVPAVFSVTFFIIPILRIPYVSRMQAKRERNIIRKKFVGVIIQAQPAELTLNELVRYANLNDKQQPMAQSVLDKLVVELQGDINLNDKGEPVFVFPRLANELKVA